MAKRKGGASVPDEKPPTVTPAQGVDLLQKQIASGEQLLAKRPLSEDDYSSWSMITRNFLEKAFGTESPNVTSVTSAGKYGSFPINAGPAWWENHRAETLRTKLHRLGALIELLQTEIRLQNTGSTAPAEPSRGHRIFLVHGHNELALHETARFLEKLKQDVVVLREQPNQGRTIVEKFEDYGDVGFAVILLTDDDMGGLRSSGPDSYRPRARQNVIFELGYFVGRLGRSRVCALYRGGVEIPSDYSGVLYIELDERGAWRLQLAKEIRAAGFPVDMNEAL